MIKAEKILGVKINTGMNIDDVLDYVEKDLLTDSETHYICTTNPEFIVDAQTDTEFKTIINNSDLSVPDGIGVVLAARYQERVSKYNKESVLYPFQAFTAGLLVGISVFLDASAAKSRIDGVGLVDSLCKLSAEKKYTVFLLGGWPKDSLGRNIDTKDDLAAQASSKLRQKYPNLDIIGATSRFSRNDSDDVATVDYIHKCMTYHGVSRLDFLFVAYNHPYQEKWIIRNVKNIPAAVSIGVGGTLDYFSGNKLPSPSIVRSANLDWLFRLVTQPWRFSRIFKAFPKFPYLVFLDSLRKNN